MRRFRSLLRRALLTTWLHLRARLLLRLGRRRRARDVLLRLVTLDPASFSAHLLLGREAYRGGRRVEAVQELAICHRLDPDRLLRQGLPRGLADEVSARSLSGPDRTFFDLTPADAGPLPGEWDDLIGTGPETAAPGPPDDPPPCTDFSDGEEYRRFQHLPPIAPGELAEVDIDGLLARLVEDPHPGGARDQG